MFLDLRKYLTLGWPKILTYIGKINKMISTPRYSQAKFLNYKGGKYPMSTTDKRKKNAELIYRGINIRLGTTNFLQQ